MARSLHRAAAENDLDALRAALSGGADPNAPDDSGQTPLLEAAEAGHEEAVGLLLQAGADPNLADHRHRTALGQAAWLGKTEIVRRLLDAGASPEGHGFGAPTPLMLATSMGRRASVELLLGRGADVNARTTDGVAAIHAASGQGKTALVQLLLDRGADPRVANQHGQTPLHAALQRAKMATVRLLLERGADVNATANDGTTPLLQAVQHGRAKIAQVLLDAGADPNIPYRQDSDFQPELTVGATPLHVASSKGKLDLVEALLAAGADPNLSNARYQTPLDVAESQGHGPLIDLLRPKTKADEGGKPRPKALGPRLVRSSFAGNADDVRALLAQGADPDSRDPQPIEQGRTALIAAAQQGHLGCVRALIDAGADVERSTLENTWLGATINPLLAASEAGHVEVVRALLDAGANVEARSTTGESSLLLASAAGHAEVVRLLLDAGADPTYLPAPEEPDLGDEEDEVSEPDSDRESLLDALSRALANGHTDVLDVFLANGIRPSPQTLVTAARRGDSGTVRRLLDLGLDPNASDADGRTALHAACGLQTEVVEHDPAIKVLDLEDNDHYLSQAAAWQATTVRLLLDRGADPNGRDAFRSTPLHVAARLQSYVTYKHAQNPDEATKHTCNEIDTAPIVRLLLERGADPNATDRKGRTPLIFAARANDRWGTDPSNVLRALLDAGADVNLADTERRTAIFPTSDASETTVRLLLDAGAEVNVHDRKRRTPLHEAVACAGDQPAIARALIDAGAEVNARDAEGTTPIDIAREYGYKKVAKLLQKHGAVGRSPLSDHLYRAVADGKLAKVRELLEAGADPHGRAFGTNAFVLAMSQGRRAIVEAFLASGADVNHFDRNSYDPSPLFAALESERMNPRAEGGPGLVPLLLDAGADPSTPNLKGWSPLLLAAWIGRRDLVDLLLAAGAREDADPRAADFLAALRMADQEGTPAFAEAIAMVQAATGEAPRPIEWRPPARAFFVTAEAETAEAMRQADAPGVARFGVEWNVLDAKARRLCNELRPRLAPLGATLLDMGRPIGCGPSGKFLVLLPTTDRFTALAACGPSPGGDYGEHGGLFLPDVVGWFHVLDAEFPFSLLGAGRDFVDVEFDREPSEPESHELALRIARFCPDSVDQGAGTRRKLAEQIRAIRRVYFWWD